MNVEKAFPTVLLVRNNNCSDCSGQYNDDQESLWKWNMQKEPNEQKKMGEGLETICD